MLGEAAPLGEGLPDVVLGLPELLADALVMGGAGTRWSPWPLPPIGRLNHRSCCWS